MAPPLRSPANYGLLKVVHFHRDVMEIHEHNFLAHLYEFSLSWTGILGLSFTIVLPPNPIWSFMFIIVFCTTGTYGFADGYLVRQSVLQFGLYSCISELHQCWFQFCRWTYCRHAALRRLLAFYSGDLFECWWYSTCSAVYLYLCGFFQSWYVWVHKKFIHSILLRWGKRPPFKSSFNTKADALKWPC